MQCPRRARRTHIGPPALATSPGHRTHSLSPSPGLVYRGQVLLGVVSHVHLGYTRCLCRGLRGTGSGHSFTLWTGLCRYRGSNAQGREGRGERCCDKDRMQTVLTAE